MKIPAHWTIDDGSVIRVMLTLTLSNSSLNHQGSEEAEPISSKHKNISNPVSRFYFHLLTISLGVRNIQSESTVQFCLNSTTSVVFMFMGIVEPQLVVTTGILLHHT